MTIRPSTRAHLAVFAFFLAVAIAITWPLLTVLSTRFAGYPFGDAHEMTRHIWWFKYAIQRGQPLIFQPLLGYPDGMQGVILWSDPLQFFPAWLFAFLMPLPAAYNLQCLLNIALNGWAAYFLMWKLTSGQRFPALAAGLVFMAAPVMQGHLAGGHGGLLVQWPLPLLAYSLIRLRQTTSQSPGSSPENTNHRLFSCLSPGTQHLALSTFFFVLLPLGHTLQLIYAGLPLIGLFGLTLLFKREWRALLRLVAVVVIGSAILFLFLLPVIQATFGTAAYADEGGGVAFSIDLLGIVTPSFNHPLYGQLAYTRRVLGVNLVEGSSYIGLIAGLLALLAVWKKRAARWWLLLAALAWVLALGPLLKIFDAPVSVLTGEYSTFITLPWALLADLPGFNLARTPGRFGFVLALAVAVMAGYGVGVVSCQFSVISQKLSAISHQPSAKDKMVAVNPPVSRFSLSPQSLVLRSLLLLLLLFDYQSYWPLPTYSAEIPAALYELAGREDVRAVFDIPWDNVLAAKDALWLQTAHQKPLIAGQVTRKTPVNPAKLTILEQTLDPALLNEAGADVVILHKQYDGDGDLADIARSKLGEPFYENEQLALWDVPNLDNPKLFTAVITSLNQITDTADSYFYVPEKGWLQLLVPLAGEGKAVFKLDNRIMTEQVINDDTGLMLDFPIISPGYHTLTLALDPPCGFNYDPVLRCPGLHLSDRGVVLSPFDPTITAVVFEKGVILKGIKTDRMRGNESVTLWWQFDLPRTDQDIRFIKLLDEAGNQAAGVDETLGAHPATSEWVETVDIPLNDISPGTYRVCVGWYSYPDLTRFAVLSDVDGAQDGLACVGEFSIPPQYRLNR